VSGNQSTSLNSPLAGEEKVRGSFQEPLINSESCRNATVIGFLLTYLNQGANP
jgi:hypothetical protein